MPLPKKIPSELRAKMSATHGRTMGNRYCIQKKLGSGNYGTAYLVHDLKNNKEWYKIIDCCYGYINVDKFLYIMLYVKF